MKKINVSEEKVKGWITDSSDRVGVDKSRLVMIRLVFLGMLAILMTRLVGLQLVQGRELRERSDNNRIYLRRIQAERGVIRDRSGQVLVINRPVFQRMVDEKGLVMPEPVIISREEAEKLKLSGREDEVAYETARYYPYGQLLAHVLGYVGEANSDELEAFGLEPGTVVGKAGLELTYDRELRGAGGTELVEVDARGRLLRRIGEKRAKAGADLGVTLRLDLQEVAMEAMAGVERGALVVSEPGTGAVLAMVSVPTFDSNAIVSLVEEVGEKKQKDLEAIFSDPDKPLLNRAIGGAYPPGSVFKVVPAVAGLETGILQAETRIEDVGELRVDEYRYGNWYFDKYGRTEGSIGVVDALKRSNDIFFYKLGEWLGPDRLAHWAEEFGFGKKTGVDLPGEVSGLVPNSLWKERARGEPWFLGNTYHFAIGQGDLLVTPLQLHQMMGVVANGGRWCKPYLVETVAGEAIGAMECREMGLSETTIELVRQGLEAACQRGGTAFPFFSFSLEEFDSKYQGQKVACKTGTAQFGDPEERTHAWFSVFAPSVRPEVMVTVLVEGGGEGSEVAAPIAKEVLEWWLRSK